MMQISKELVLNTIEKMPDNIDVEDLMYRIYVMEKVHSGRESLKTRNPKSADDLLKEMETW